MKRVIALLLCALLLVPAMSANASSVSGERLEAYINENGRVSCALDGGNYDELPFDGVKKIVYAGEWEVYLTAQTMEGDTALFCWSPLLGTQDSSVLIAAVAGDPVYVARDNAIYYLAAENPRQLMKCGVDGFGQTQAVRLLPSAACELSEAMDGLYITISGPWKSYFSRVLDAETNTLRPASFDADAVWHNFGDFETQLTVEHGLELRMAGETEWRAVTSDNVFAQAAMNGKLYYLMNESETASWLACYDPAETADQLNPITTLSDGAFAWVVPEGQWQVRLTKPGYLEARSQWMDVPPEYTDVYLGMAAEAAPEVAYCNVYADRAEITFSQYMDCAKGATVTVGGKAVDAR